MSKVIGVDWASHGWLSVIVEGESVRWEFFPTITDLWHAHSDATRLCVDIPIGLATQERRACDVAAKAVLGTRGNSVFYTPVRDAVESSNISEAKQVQEDMDFSVQSQAWALVPRIRELDHFLNRRADTADVQIHETHPEVAFAALNDGDPLDHPKDTEDGEHERLTLLQDVFESPEDHFEEMTAAFQASDYAMKLAGRDDVLDAMVAAAVAKHAPPTLPSLPQDNEPERDPKRDHPMEIVYYPDVDWS